jgi:hypothetical protein
MRQKGPHSISVRRLASCRSVIGDYLFSWNETVRLADLQKSASRASGDELWSIVDNFVPLLNINSIVIDVADSAFDFNDTSEPNLDGDFGRFRVRIFDKRRARSVVVWDCRPIIICLQEARHVYRGQNSDFFFRRSFHIVPGLELLLRECQKLH